MLLSALLPRNTPAWVRLAVEAGVPLAAARFLLWGPGPRRRSPPPGHAWMLHAWHTALTDGRGLVPALTGQAGAAASQAARAVASRAMKRGASALARAGRPGG